jgi:hypothetical protein
LKALTDAAISLDCGYRSAKLQRTATSHQAVGNYILNVVDQLDRRHTEEGVLPCVTSATPKVTIGVPLAQIAD